MPSFVIYARKSTESDDRQVKSIDSQIDELRVIAMRRGIRVAEVLSESRSAKAPGRPVFGELLRRVNKGEIVGVLCWKMDRLARNHLDTGLILQALAEGKLHEVITSDRTYTRDGNDRFMGSFELGMATKYIDDLRANVRRGNRARFQRGWVNHNPPLGYLLDPTSKAIVKDPARFDLVRRMWELLLTAAYRPDRILDTANHEWGFRTRKFKRIGGNLLSRSVLYSIFANPFYMGLIRLRSGETYVGAHPSMVMKEEFDRAQAILGRPGRSRPQRHEFAYTGLFMCGNCGAMITAEEHVKPSGRRYVYYRCTRRKTGIACREAALPERVLEEQVVTTLKTIEMPEKILDWICRRAATTFKDDIDRKRAALASLEAALASLNREKETLLALRLKDLVDDATFASERTRIEEGRQRLQAQLASPGRSQEEIARLTVESFTFASSAADRFVSGTGVQKRMILEATGLNFRLQSRKARYELKKPFRIISEAGSCLPWSACIDDVRTWIQDTTEYFKLPDLTIPAPAATPSLPHAA